jgi:hypothetical protein
VLSYYSLYKEEWVSKQSCLSTSVIHLNKMSPVIMNPDSAKLHLRKAAAEATVSDTHCHTQLRSDTQLSMNKILTLVLDYKFSLSK